MGHLNENFSSIFILILGIMCLQYGIINRNKKVVQAKLLNNFQRLIYYAAASLSLMNGILGSLSVMTLLYAIPIILILFYLQYRGGYFYGNFVDNSLGVGEVIKQIKSHEKIVEVLETHPAYDIYLKRNESPFGVKERLCIKSGLDVALANDIKGMISEDLMKYDNSSVMAWVYILGGLVFTTSAFL